MTENRFWKNLHPKMRRERRPQGEEDTNYAILNAIDESLKDLEEETIKSKIESSLKTATGFFLEEYGDFFGVYRKRNRIEPDEQYRGRIIEALDLPRGTNDAIARAVRRYLEDKTIGVKVYEPWEHIFYLNGPPSTLNSDYKLQGTYYHFAVIDVHVGTPLEQDLVDVIEEYKPAGVMLNTTYDPNMRDFGEEQTGVTPYPAYGIYESERLYEIFNQLKQPLRGRMSLVDSKRLRPIFRVNIDRMNNLSVLGGNYGAMNENLHLAGIGRDFEPETGYRMTDVNVGLDVLPRVFYKDLREEGATYPVELDTTEQLYFAFDASRVFNERYPKLNRYSEDYNEIITNARVVLGAKTTAGDILDLQVYNFIKNRWESIERSLSRGGYSVVKAHIGDGQELLSKRGILYLRIKGAGKVSIDVGGIDIEYEDDIYIDEAGPKLQALPSHPIITREPAGMSLTNLIDKAMVGYATLPKKESK